MKTLKLTDKSAYDLAEELIMNRVSTDQCLALLANELTLKFALDLKFHMYMSQGQVKPEYERFFYQRIKEFKKL